MSSAKKELVSGVLYTAIARYSGIFVQIFVAGILARLLAPSDFGILSMALVAATFFQVVADFGFGPAIIQRKDLNQYEIREIFTWSIILGSGLAMLFFASGKLIALWYSDMRILPVLQILPISLFLSMAASVPAAVLRKEKKFRFIAGSGLIVQILVGVFSVMVIRLGAGILGLVYGMIFGGVLALISQMAAAGMLPKRISDTNSLKKVIRFSSYQMLANIMTYFSRNLDSLFIGKYLGAFQLGLYDKSYRLMLMPIQNVSHVVTPILHPILSDFQNDTVRLAGGYLKVLRLMALIGFPLSAFLYYAAPNLILIVYGENWNSAVPIFQILSISVGFQMVASTSGAIFQAANDTKGLFLMGLLGLVTLGSGIVYGVFFIGTTQSVSWMIVASYCVLFFLNFVYLFRVTLDSSLMPLISAILPALVIAGGVTAILAVLQSFLADFGNVAALCVTCAVTILSYAALLAITREWAFVKAVMKR